MSIIRKKITSVDRDEEKLEPSYVPDAAVQKTIWQFPPHPTHTELNIDLAIVS